MESSDRSTGSTGLASTEPIRMALAMKFTDETSTGSGEATDCNELLAALSVEGPLEGGRVGDFRLALFRTSTGFPFCERYSDINTTCKILKMI